MACKCPKIIGENFQFQEIFTCRRILYVMVITGFMLNAALKVVFNIAIVAMVNTENQTNTDNVFDWTESQKQDIIGIFFWGFAFTKIPSGRLAEVVGSRKVTGFSMALASILTLLTPAMAFWNYYVLLCSRVLLGFLIGASWPAIMPLAAKWIPPKDYSVFVTCVASTGVGVAISFLFCGFLIGAYGWKSAFYAMGALGLIWSAPWFYLIYDSPEQHPRISLKEKYLLEKQIEQRTKRKQLGFRDVPWLELGKSGAVWAIVAGQGATFFLYATLSNELPSYLDQVLHLAIEQNGAFSGLPQWGGYIASVISGYVADHLRKLNKLSVTTIRKLFETVGLAVPSICCLVLAFWGDVTPVALTAFTLSLTINAITTSGHCANILDISRNFSGTICGIVNTVSALGAYVSTQIVAVLLKNGHSYDEWRPLFWILFGLCVVAIAIYLAFCSAEIQPWDSIKKQTKANDKEMQLINAKNAN